jgi:hypothetical protein
MVILFVRHTVENFTTQKKAYDAFLPKECLSRIYMF